jgi:SpoVK/Ycf46/Vps4 family AAA+-type ATPase
MAAIAEADLGVIPYVEDEELKVRSLPEDLDEVFNHHILKPLVNGERELAAMSMLLHGPPGTAKTTVAKAIAQRLEWPLLELNQSAFLRRGLQNLDAEAERVFQLLGHLRNAVVLLDEIEGMVESRATVRGNQENSYFLTTAMLPRLHHLRESARIIFIIATNHIDHVDPAARRLGRIDIIRYVGPPNEDSRFLALVKGAHKLECGPEIVEMLDSEEFRDRVRRPLANAEPTYGYLNEIVRRFRLTQQSVGFATDPASVMTTMCDIVEKVCKQCEIETTLAKGDSPPTVESLRGYNRP